MAEGIASRGRRRDSSRPAIGRVRDLFRLRPASGEFATGLVVLVGAGAAGLLFPVINDFYWLYLVASTALAGGALLLVGWARRRRQRSAAAEGGGLPKGRGPVQSTG